MLLYPYLLHFLNHYSHFLFLPSFVSFFLFLREKTPKQMNRELMTKIFRQIKQNCRDNFLHEAYDEYVRSMRFLKNTDNLLVKYFVLCTTCLKNDSLLHLLMLSFTIQSRFYFENCEDVNLQILQKSLILPHAILFSNNLHKSSGWEKEMTIA